MYKKDDISFVLPDSFKDEPPGVTGSLDRREHAADTITVPCVWVSQKWFLSPLWYEI